MIPKPKNNQYLPALIEYTYREFVIGSLKGALLSFRALVAL